MNSIKSLKSISVVLALLVTLGFASVASATTRAQGDRTHDRGQGDQGRWNRMRMTRYAFALGYNRGYDDASQGNYRSYREIQRYREGTEGFEDPMGTRNSFRDNFKRGFARGFMDARSHRNRRYTQSDVDRIRQDSNDRRDR
jgi:hypothetical protein